jgi:hypothetical protein
LKGPHGKESHREETGREEGRVAIRFMDADERNVIAETTIAAQLREVTLHHEGEPYMASHQDGDIWVYRRTL